MSNNKVEQLLRQNLTMYPHLKVIRDNLWSKDGKSRVSVMVGAGFSLNASKIEDEFSGIALWDDLKYMLTQNLKHHLDIEYRDILEIAQLYEEEYGRASLDELLKEAIPDENYEPGILHYNLLNLPWADIYTTNYDTLLERTKRNIYERNYQIIYDVNDIPNSTSPRIIKLHGSFPSNRPFIFTKNDYDRYPKQFSPFVNMVQQSIMETTFVLLGFSGDDPNFDRWITWVKENFGEQMPKIYMIGYGQKNRLGYLKSKGITLIDFEEVYSSVENPYREMFTDLFKFLSYKDREEKTKWPYISYNNVNLSIEKFKYNREGFPGWIVIPDEIRRSNAYNIKIIGNKKISEIESLQDKENIELISEILWCYEHFYIPLDFQTHQKLKGLVNEIAGDTDESINDILLFLLKEARLDCNKDEFDKYKELLYSRNLNKLQSHKMFFEDVLFNLAFNQIGKVKEKLNIWDVGEKDIEWGIRKAAILIKIFKKSEAKEVLQGYLQSIRNLLAIQSDDYRLLSLESVVLSLLQKIKNERDYGYDRLRMLNLKNCYVQKEFQSTLLSVKKYEYELGTKQTPGFDPGQGKITSKMGDYFKQELLDSFAILQIEELFYLDISDQSQYELSLKNLEIQYPLYSQIKRIHALSIKKIDDFFNREFVYKLDDSNLDILLNIFKDAMEEETPSIIDKDIALEIVSRIYFALNQEVKLEIDLKITDYMNSIGSLENNIKQELNNLIKRIFFDKSNSEQKEFCEKLIEINIFNQSESNNEFYKDDFFDPILAILSATKDVSNLSNLSVPEDTISEMLCYLQEDDNVTLKESALIRLTFLAKTNSLSDENEVKFIGLLKMLESKYGTEISNFLHYNVFDKLINSSNEISMEGKELLLKKDIPKLQNQNGKYKEYYLHPPVLNYFYELYELFPPYTEKETRKIPDSQCYKQWLNKFYSWWDDQEKFLLYNIKKENAFLPSPDYLQSTIIFLKNSILSVAPLNVFNKNDMKKLEMIFEKVDNKRSDLSLYLVPSFERLNVPCKYSYKTIIDVLKSKEQSKVEMALDCVYDYLTLISNKDLELDIEIFKNELFNIIYYSTDRIFKASIDILKVCIKNIPNIFNANDYELLSNFLNNYFQLIKSNNVEISTLNDFEMLTSIAGLVTYLHKNAESKIKDELIEWTNYIKNHRLPEVRKYYNIIK